MAHSFSTEKNYSVADTFEEAGLELHTSKRAGEVATTCPQCSPGRKKSKDKCLGVNLDKGRWRCSHCNYAGRLTDESDKMAERQRADQPQRVYAQPKLVNHSPYSDRLVAWFAERRISLATLEHFQIRQALEWMPQAFRAQFDAIRELQPELSEDEAKREANQRAKVTTIQFPYFVGGEVVNIKYRTAKKEFKLAKDAKLVFYNLDAVRSARECIIVEGEPDALTWHEAGYPHVISVPNGAALSKEERAEYEKTGQFNDANVLNLEYLDNCWDDLQHIETFYIAGDTDAPGMKLRRELVRRLGAERCKIVLYEGYKDANELAVKSGSIYSLKACYEAATGIPVDGISTVESEMPLLLDYFDNGLPHGLPIGIREFEGHYSLRLGELNAVTGVPGDGKCLGKGTKVMMYDGTFKVVEDIVAGDQLMGPDSTPRNVLSIARGREQMYWVRQKSGLDYRVNESHILTLRRSRPKVKGVPELLDISVREVLAKPKSFMETTWKGFKAPGVEFAVVPVIRLDPYFLGVWLGDGTSASCSKITNVEPEIAAYLEQHAREWGLQYRHIIHAHRTPSHTITTAGGKGSNPLLNAWKSYGLQGNKHIPADFLLNTREHRLQLLAGLLDTDGSWNGRMYEITQKNQVLAEQIVQLSRCLGFYTTKRQKQATMKRADGSVYACEVSRIHISGNDLSVIPCRVARKKAQPSPATRNCDALSTGISLEKDIVDDYYGFVIDGDHRFLLEDLTVTHNTTFMLFLAVLTSIRYGWKWLIHSPENYPAAKVFVRMVQIVVGNTMSPKDQARMSREEYLNALNLHIAKHFFIVDSNAVNTHGGLRQLIEQCVRRFGIQATLIDPWNDVEEEKEATQDLTKYITKELSLYRKTLRQTGTSLYINAHPRTLRKTEATANAYPVAQADDIYGGNCWWNRADNIFCVHRPRFINADGSFDLTTDIHVHKIKEQDLVGKPTMPENPVRLNFELRTGRYHGQQSFSTIAEFMDTANGFKPKTLDERAEERGLRPLRQTPGANEFEPEQGNLFGVEYTHIPAPPLPDGYDYDQDPPF